MFHPYRYRANTCKTAQNTEQEGSKGIRFSTILPRYLGRTPFLDNLISVEYLKGVSTGDYMKAN